MANIIPHPAVMTLAQETKPLDPQVIRQELI